MSNKQTTTKNLPKVYSPLTGASTGSAIAVNQNSASTALSITNAGTGTALTLNNSGISGCTGVSFAAPDPRRLYCDRPEHRMYRAIRETCPCFKDRDNRFGDVYVRDGAQGVYDQGGHTYFIDSDGLARRMSSIFERLDVQEELINELRNEVARLKESQA